MVAAIIWLSSSPHLYNSEHEHQLLAQNAKNKSRLVVTCWERADPLALLYVMFFLCFVTFPCGVLGKVWCLIVSIPDFVFLLTLITALFN